MESRINIYESQNNFIFPLPVEKNISGCNKILVVEDNIINQKVAKIMLEDLGYVVDIAASGKEALYLTATHKYTLILMDVGLPDMDGLEITRKIRAQENDDHIPIIACTANGDSYRDKCLQAGMDDFTLKPIMLDELKQVLAKYI